MKTDEKFTLGLPTYKDVMSKSGQQRYEFFRDNPYQYQKGNTIKFPKRKKTNKPKPKPKRPKFMSRAEKIKMAGQARFLGIKNPKGGKSRHWYISKTSKNKGRKVHYL